MSRIASIETNHHSLDNGLNSTAYVYLKGLAGIGSGAGRALYKTEECAKVIADMFVRAQGDVQKGAEWAIYIEEEPVGMLSRTIPILDVLNRAGSDELCEYNISGYVGRGGGPNTVVHLIDAAFWHKNYKLEEGQPGYLGNSIANHYFHFEHVKPSVSFGGITIDEFEVPQFPDGITNRLPYYIVVKINKGDSYFYRMVFSDQIINIIYNTEENAVDYLRAVGNFEVYDFEPTLDRYLEGFTEWTNTQTGSNADIDIGNISGSHYVMTCNFVLRSPDSSAYMADIHPLMSAVVVVIDNLPARMLKLQYIDSDIDYITVEIVGGVSMEDFSYVALPTIAVDEGTNTNTEGDYPTVTISGTAPIGTKRVYVSYYDGDISDASKLDYLYLCNHIITYTSILADGSFGVQFDSKYHESIRTTTTLTYDNVITYDHMVVWCDTNGVLTASVNEVVHNECLAGDTLITMADGSSKMLCELKEGDLVLSGDGSPTAVTKLSRGVISSSHTYYTFSDGTVIDETYEHRFFNVTQGFWQKLRLWNVGDKARKADGSTVTLDHIETVKENAEQFGVWTESHDYYANSLLSGDIRANLKFIPDVTIDEFIDMIASASTKNLLAELEEAK